MDDIFIVRRMLSLRSRKKIMVKKCLIPECNPNYKNRKGQRASEKKVPVFRFPRDPTELSAWMKMLPFKDVKVTKDTVICERHWPTSYPTVSRKGKLRPRDPPSVWPGVPPSCCPDPPPPPPLTKRSSVEIRAVEPDEMDAFMDNDKVSYEDIVDRVVKNRYEFRCPTVAYENDDHVFIQSTSFSEGVPKFVVDIKNTLEFKSFHMGIKVTISCIIKNNIRILNPFSAIEELISSLDLYEASHKVDILHQQIKSMRTPSRGQKMYSPDEIVRAFTYYVTSRSLYNQMRKDYPLPSITTLNRITSSFSNLSAAEFVGNILNSLTEKQKLCIILHDEIYVKKMLQFHGGEIFWKSSQRPFAIGGDHAGSDDQLPSWRSKISFEYAASI